MKTTTFILSLVFTLTVPFANAVETCSALFASDLQSFINTYRQSHIIPLQSDLPMLEPGYSLIGFLGESTAKAYLGINTKTKDLVTVKRGRIIEMLWREIIVTDYLLENGEIVPKILKASIKMDGTTIIVREYFKGLTGEELNRELKSGNVTLPPELSTNASKLLELEITRLKNLFFKGDEKHLSFQDWYRANATRLEEKYREIWQSIKEMNRLDPTVLPLVSDVVFMQDFSESNFLFDIQRDRWVVFDP